MIFYDEKIQFFDGFFIKFAKVEFELDLDSVPISFHFANEFLS